MANLLIIIRDSEAWREFCDTLIEKGLECSLVTDINGVSEGITEHQPDAILLEITRRWPNEEMRGFIRRLKRERNIPVIVLVSEDALETFEDEVDFDDFIIGPYNATETSLRINRILHKHKKTTSEDVIEVNDLQLDLVSCEVSVDNRIVDLTFKEYELLKLLATNRGRVFTRDNLLDKIWGYDYFGGDRTVDVHIRRLRSKIEDANHSYIETVRNIGYKFVKNN
jgi:DNA-binding response OmpR family regulator